MDLYKWLKNQWDRALAIAAAVAGAVFLVLGWLGASGSDLTTEQIPYLASGAVAGLFALGVAATLWLSADMRDEWLKLDKIHQLMQDDAEHGQALGTAGDSGEDTAEVALPAPAQSPAKPRRARVAARSN